jgi:hypothetical protein
MEDFVMWDDIGGKIKFLAKVIAWIGILSSIIVGIIFISEGIQLHYCIGIIVIGSLISWISSWFMFGFGELIEKATDIENNTRKGISINSLQNTIVNKNNTDESIKNIEENNKKIIYDVIDTVSLRKAANDSAEVICELIKGVQVYTTNIHKQFNYIYVFTLDDKKGWILEKNIKQNNSV